MRHLLLVCSALALATPAHSASYIRLLPFTDTADLRDSFGGRSYRTTTRAVSGQPYSNGTAPGIAANRQQPYQTVANTFDLNLNAISGAPSNPVFEIPGLSVDDVGLDYVGTCQDVIAQSSRPGDPGNCYLSFMNWNHPVFGQQLNGALNINVNPASIFYFGFTWGSMDEYNTLSILPRSPIDPEDPEDTLFAQAADGSIIGAFPTKFVTGAELATAFGVPLYDDYYVEIRSDASLGQIRLLTTNLAFEIDGLAAGVANVRNYGCLYAADPTVRTWSPTCANAAPTRRRLPAPINVKTLPGAPDYVYDAINPLIDQYYNSGGGIRPGVTSNIGVANDPLQVAVPAPAALALFGFGFAGLFAARRRAR